MGVLLLRIEHTPDNIQKSQPTLPTSHSVRGQAPIVPFILELGV